MRIYVGGSLQNVPRDQELCREFVCTLGREIVKRGHVLLGGCRSSVDQELARAAHEWLTSNKGNPEQQIVSYCLRSDQPVHRFGRVRASELSDWQMNHPRLVAPEQIELADATIFIAGNEGTFWAKNWSFYARKPILGVPRFGGAGEEIYRQELERLRMRAASLVDDYEVLNQLGIDTSSFAQEVVALAERLVIPRTVFTVMSFEREFRDVYASYKEVCKECGFDAQRTDESTSAERIVPRIETGIRQSAFVIADVSRSTSNVFYEVGFARGLGKDVILTAKRGTELPFDLHDLPTIYWEIQEDLKDGLRKCLSGLKSSFGR
jgi:hypothetical protein